MDRKNWQKAVVGLRQVKRQASAAGRIVAQLRREFAAEVSEVTYAPDAGVLSVVAADKPAFHRLAHYLELTRDTPAGPGLSLVGRFERPATDGPAAEPRLILWRERPPQVRRPRPSRRQPAA